jgi:hypothetical protein
LWDNLEKRVFILPWNRNGPALGVNSLAGIAGPTVQDYVVNTLGEDLSSFYFCKLHLGFLEVAKNVIFIEI